MEEERAEQNDEADKNNAQLQTNRTTTQGLTVMYCNTQSYSSCVRKRGNTRTAVLSDGTNTANVCDTKEPAPHVQNYFVDMYVKAERNRNEHKQQSNQ